MIRAAARREKEEAMPELLLRSKQLAPNHYNPNRMTDDEFAELVVEVRHLGRLPKPIVVRPNGNGYVIVDGEYSWRAAGEAGLKKVTCEIVDVDDFEAMRQTYKRNQHGTHNPVLLGRMFRRMIEDRQLSHREIAAEIEVSEGTIRNALAYAEAADLRNSYAENGGAPVGKAWDRKGNKSTLRWATPDEEIAELGVREVRSYLSLPAPIRDKWFAAGHAPKAIDQALQIRMRLNQEETKETAVEIEFETLAALANVGLADAITQEGFVESCHRAIRIYFWREHFSKVFGVPGDLDAHILAAAKLGLDVDLLDIMPVSTVEDHLECLLPVAEWEDLLKTCQDRSEDRAEFWSMYSAAVDLAIRRQGHSPQDVTDPRVMLAMERIKEAPEFIRGAEYLTLHEKLWLYELELPDLQAEEVTEIKRQAVEDASEKRGFLADKDIDEGMREYVGSLPCTIDAIVRICLDELRRDKEHQHALSCLDDPDRMVEIFVEARVPEDKDLREGTIGGRPAKDVLRERLLALPRPEKILLLGGLVLGQVYGPRWLHAVKEEMGDGAGA